MTDDCSFDGIIFMATTFAWHPICNATQSDMRMTVSDTKTNLRGSVSKNATQSAMRKTVSDTKTNTFRKANKTSNGSEGQENVE